MSAHDLARPIEILLVEDSPGDARLTREALRAGKIHTLLNVVTDGEMALAYLHRQGPYTAPARPDAGPGLRRGGSPGL